MKYLTVVIEGTNNNVSKSPALAPTRYKQSSTKFSRRKKCLMILDHSGPVTKMREILVEGRDL